MLVLKTKDITNLYRQIYSILQLDKHKTNTQRNKSNKHKRNKPQNEPQKRQKKEHKKNTILKKL